MQDAILKDSALRRDIGADYYTISLREAVTACVDAARNAAAVAD
jgi:hypothetical protein